ncbi:MAG: S8 family serine peptidase [Gemmatimonadota bacterium]
MRFSRARRTLFYLLGILLFINCGGDGNGPSNQAPALIVALSGTGQTGSVGQLLAAPIVVKVTNSAGAAVSGIVVTFNVTAGGGSLAASTVTTNGQGTASVGWTVGQTVGTNIDTVTATIPGSISGSPVTFTASTAAGPATLITLISGDQQSAEVGHPVPQPLVVEVKDQFGNLSVGRQVAWQITSGGGSVQSAASITDAQGRATMTWTLGNTVGTAAQIVRAQISSSGVNFSATGFLTSGTLAIASGNNQNGPSSGQLASALVVTVKTPGNGLVAGDTVSWAVASGGGTLSAPTSITNVQGQATITWTLGAGAGAQTVTASSAGLTGSPVTFTATGVIAPANTIVGSVALSASALSAPRGGTRVGAFFSGLRGTASRFGTQSFRMGTGDAPMRAMVQPTPVPGARYTRNDLLVTFKPAAISAPPLGAMSAASFSLAQSVGISMHSALARHEAPGIMKVSDVSPVIMTARVWVDPSKMDSIASALSADPTIASVSRNMIVYSHELRGYSVPVSMEELRAVATSGAAGAGLRRVPGGTIPNDPSYPNQSWHYVMVDAPRAWSITTGSSSVLVAVVDAGIRFDHPAIAANLTNDGYDFVSLADTTPLCAGGSITEADDGNAYDPDPTMPDDRDFDQSNNCALGHSQVGAHGLHVAGIIGAVGNDGVSVVGLNWTVRIRPVRVLGVTGSGSTFDVAQGVLYAAGLPAAGNNGGITAPPAAGAKIINMSLGGGCPAQGQPDVLHNAISAATNAGSLVIVSAGNSGDQTPQCPASYPEVLAVSAVGPDGVLASYSSFGSSVGISAPGGDIADGNLAGGDGTFGVFSSTCDFTTTPCTPNFAREMGTSQAAPHVSGVAALILAANPGLTASQLRTRLTQWAVDAGTPGFDPLYGAGIVNARNSLTQSLAAPAVVYAQVYDATTGAIVATQQTGAGGSFNFLSIPNGTYFVYAGEDENGDGIIGAAGRRWGAFGGSAAPATVTVSGTTGGTAFFTIGTPVEKEGNNSIAASSRLVVGGWMAGSADGVLDPSDVYRVDLATGGQYTFQTSGLGGAFCRFALSLNTVLTLSDAQGAQLAADDDANAGASNYCSVISTTLTPGTYFLTVTTGPDFGLPPVAKGSYRIEARSGP